MGRKPMNLKHSLLMKLSDDDRRMLNLLIENGINVTQMFRNALRKKYKELSDEKNM